METPSSTSIPFKNSHTENVKVQNSIVQTVYKKIPKSLDASTEQINLCSFCVVYKHDDVVIMARFSRLSPYTIKEKFLVENHEDINLKSLKLNQNFLFEDAEPKTRNNFITETDVVTKYTFKDLCAIRCCFKKNNIQLPNVPGVYLITSCTKKWIKYTNMPTLDGIERILTLRLLKQYYNQIEDRHKKVCTCSTFCQPATVNTKNMQDVKETPQNVGKLCVFKDGFLEKYNGSDFSKSSQDYERAYKFIKLLSSCVEIVVLSHYMIRPSTFKAKQICTDWSNFFLSDTFKVLYPEMFQPNGERIVCSKDSFNVQAVRRVFRDLFDVVNNVEYYAFYNKPKTSSLQDHATFSQIWSLFKNAVKKFVQNRNKYSATLIANVNRQTNLNNSLSKQTLSSRPGTLRKSNKKKEVDAVSEAIIDRNAVESRIEERLCRFNAETACFNKVPDQQSIELLKYEFLDFLTERITKKVLTTIRAEINTGMTEALTTIRAEINTGMTEALTTTRAKINTGMTDVITTVRAAVNTRMAEVDAKIKKIIKKKIKKNNKKLYLSFKQRNLLSKRPNINDHMDVKSSTRSNDENRG